MRVVFDSRFYVVLTDAKESGEWPSVLSPFALRKGADDAQSVPAEESWRRAAVAWALGGDAVAEVVEP